MLSIPFQWNGKVYGSYCGFRSKGTGLTLWRSHFPWSGSLTLALLIFVTDGMNLDAATQLGWRGVSEVQ